MRREEIEKFLDSASTAYYSGYPFLSDEQFDNLAEKIGYKKVGSSVKSNSCRHYKRLYSLQKYYADSKDKKPLDDVSYDLSYSPKLDGTALSLLYIDGELVTALTRGDGIEGKDVTSKILALNILPKKVNIHNSNIVQVVGEITAPKHIENARNYAAGALNLKDVNELKTRAISFFAYDVYPNITNSYDSDMKLLSRIGFGTVKDPHIQDIYPTDGIVYRVNDNKKAASMGYTSKHPKFAYAVKERQECVETTILDVVWQTGRSGKVTPVAILEPVKIEDKEVSRATLNNVDFIEALDLSIGDTVGIRLAGQIIPEIVYRVDQ